MTPLDAERIVQVLNRHGVEYVLVGGLGARLHGATRLTNDLDLCPSWQRPNLERLAAALRELDARLRDFPRDVQLPPITVETLRRIEIGTWTTSAGDLDVLRGIPSGEKNQLNRYENLTARASAREVVGCTIYVADLEDIIVSKEAANRAKDQEALPELRSLRAAQLAAAAYPEGIDGALAQDPSPDRPPTEFSSGKREYRQEPPGPSMQ